MTSLWISLTNLFSSAFTATILSVAYGITIKDSDDPYISTAETALNGLADAGIPGTYWVDYLPFLKHVPSWLPGAGFKRKAAYWGMVNKDMVEKPFLHVKDQLVSWSIIGVVLRIQYDADSGFLQGERNCSAFSRSDIDRKVAGRERPKAS